MLFLNNTDYVRGLRTKLNHFKVSVYCSNFDVPSIAVPWINNSVLVFTASLDPEFQNDAEYIWVRRKVNDH